MKLLHRMYRSWFQWWKGSSCVWDQRRTDTSYSYYHSSAQVSQDEFKIGFKLESLAKKTRWTFTASSGLLIWSWYCFLCEMIAFLFCRSSYIPSGLHFISLFILNFSRVFFHQILEIGSRCSWSRGRAAFHFNWNCRVDFETFLEKKKKKKEPITFWWQFISHNMSLFLTLNSLSLKNHSEKKTDSKRDVMTHLFSHSLSILVLK